MLIFNIYLIQRIFRQRFLGINLNQGIFVMVKTNEHIKDLRKHVIACSSKGEDYDKISKKLNLPKSTI